MSRSFPTCAPLILAGLLLALTTVAAAAQERSPAADRIDALVEDGRRALEKGKHAKAAKRFEKADAIAGGTSPGALVGLAQAHLDLGEYQEALEHADRLLPLAETDRQRAKAHHLIGLAYFGRAMELEIEVTAPGRYSTDDRGRRRTELHKTAGEMYRAAADAFRRVVETTGGGAGAAWQSWADALYRAGEADRALEVLDRYAEETGGKENLPERSRALASCAEVAARARRMVFVPEEVESPEQIRELRAERGIGTDTELLITGEEGYEPPKRIHSPAPQYTELARKSRVTGTVVVWHLIDAEGRVVCPRVIRSLPHGLTESVLETLFQWRFEPARHDGEPVAIFWELSINFNLS